MTTNSNPKFFNLGQFLTRFRTNLVIFNDRLVELNNLDSRLFWIIKPKTDVIHVANGLDVNKFVDYAKLVSEGKLDGETIQLWYIIHVYESTVS